MSRRDELISKYAADLKERTGMTADMDLLTKVTKGCGPTIYSDDASTVSGTDSEEMERVKKNFLIKKLGLKDGPELDAASPRPSRSMVSPTGTSTARCFITCSSSISDAKPPTPEFPPISRRRSRSEGAPGHEPGATMADMMSCSPTVPSRGNRNGQTCP